MKIAVAVLICENGEFAAARFTMARLPGEVAGPQSRERRFRRDRQSLAETFVP